MNQILNSLFIMTLLFNISTVFNRMKADKSIINIISENSEPDINFIRYYGSSFSAPLTPEQTLENIKDQIKNYVHVLIEVNNMTITYPLLLNISVYSYYLFTKV